MKFSGRSVVWLVAACCLWGGCSHKEPEYGRELTKTLAVKKRQVWAVAPVINLSGQHDVDPFLQADLLFEQLQQVQGITVIPVNRVAEVYAALRIERVSSAEQAALVCDLLKCDALVVSAVTIFDSYNPPKFGAAVQLFVKPGTFVRPVDVDPRELARRAAPREGDAMPQTNEVIQTVGMFDAQNGSVRERLHLYAMGRHDPVGPLAEKEYYVSMDRYCGFVYSELIEQIIASPKFRAMR